MPSFLLRRVGFPLILVFNNTINAYRLNAASHNISKKSDLLDR